MSNTQVNNYRLKAYFKAYKNVLNVQHLNITNQDVGKFMWCGKFLDIGWLSEHESIV